MARIRTIKPEFWSDAKIVKLSIPARLLFIAILGLADDHGRGRYSPKEIAAFAFPEDDDLDAREFIDELITAGRIHVYVVGDQRFFHVANFAKHQYIKEKIKTRFPDPVGICECCAEIPPKSGGNPEEIPGVAAEIPPLEIGNRKRDHGILEKGSVVGDPVAHEGAHETPSASVSLRSLDQPTSTTSVLGEVGLTSGDEAGAEEGCVEIHGWKFMPADIEQMATATADLALEALELPMAISSRLSKRCLLAAENPMHLPPRVLATWNAMPGNEVADWSMAGMAVGRRKAMGDPGRWLDLAAGAIGRDLQVGANLPAAERQRGQMAITGSPGSGHRHRTDAIAANAEVERVKTHLEDPETDRNSKHGAKLARAAASIAYHGAGSPKTLEALERAGVTAAEVAAWSALQVSNAQKEVHHGSR